MGEVDPVDKDYLLRTSLSYFSSLPFEQMYSSQSPPAIILDFKILTLIDY